MGLGRHPYSRFLYGTLAKDGVRERDVGREREREEQGVNMPEGAVLEEEQEPGVRFGIIVFIQLPPGWSLGWSPGKCVTLNTFLNLCVFSYSICKV